MEKNGKGNEQKTDTNAADINATVSIITFNVNDLNMPIKNQDCQSG